MSKPKRPRYVPKHALVHRIGPDNSNSARMLDCTCSLAGGGSFILRCSSKAMILRPRSATTRYKSEHILGLRMHLLLAALWNVVLQFTFVKTQFSHAECLEEFTWMTNTKGQNPCFVAASLYYPCTGPEDMVPPLDYNYDMYDVPNTTDSLECGCNTVIYTALMACQLCQTNTLQKILAWTDYTTHCVNKTILSYPRPVPSGTAIPAWMYQNVTKTNRFNVYEAIAASEQGLPDTTGTNTPPIPTVPPASASPLQDVGVIVGAAVGGVLGLALLGVLLYHVLLRRRHYERVAQGQAAEKPATSAAIRRTQTRQDTDRSMSLLSTYTMPIYNPDDPSTFPPPPTPGPSSPFSSRASSPGVGAPIIGHMRTFSVTEKYAPTRIFVAEPESRAGTIYTPPPPFSSRAPSPAVGAPARAFSAMEGQPSPRIVFTDSKSRAGTY
ncbi:hypothetical protein OH76DRAFT_62051 [Lentinus brumalis]|uniref:Uncharacterized protein n=1 Tax=Lentinus brumalis TaxID=2498619 RepID=A0A371DKF6_9APHY|nr:hypothetical protein OH76DRAFT_62051 [Polyporus brumalis]